MVIALRAALSLLGLLFVFMGAGFLLDPVGSGGDFGLSAAGPQGLASIRGDMTAFFWVAGMSLLIGAWTSNATAARVLLRIAAALMGIVFLARGFSAVVDGTYADWYLPMAVEGLTVVLALIGSRVLAERSSA